MRLLNEFVNNYLYGQRAKLNRLLGNLPEAKADQQKHDAYLAAEKAKWDYPNHYYNYK